MSLPLRHLRIEEKKKRRGKKLIRLRRRAHLSLTLLDNLGDIHQHLRGIRKVTQSAVIGEHGGACAVGLLQLWLGHVHLTKFDCVFGLETQNRIYIGFG